MTTLEAVNAMIKAVGDAPVLALESGQDTEAGLAEATLDEWVGRVLEEQSWRFNSRDQVMLTVPDVRIIVSGGAGTFLYDEIVTESVSLATGTFAYLETVGATTYMHIRRVTGTFTGAQTLTGGTSAATKTGSTYAARTSGKIPEPKTGLADANGTLVITGYGRSVGLQVHSSANFLFDFDRPYDPATGLGGLIWQAAPTVDYVLKYAFGNIPPLVQRYIADMASVEYNALRGDQQREAHLRERAGMSRLRALQAEEKGLAVNILTQSHHVQAVRGRSGRSSGATDWYEQG